MAEDIRHWLASIGLSEHADAFVENAVDRTLLPYLTNEDLKDVGVTKLGDRKKLLLAIEQLETDNDDALETPTVTNVSSTGWVEAERRQLTVMFCDLVGSTELSQQMDPEDLRQIMRRYQDAVAGAVSRYGGHINKYLGDGVLAYFGWPQAYEDQAERSVRASLDARDAVRLVRLPSGEPLAVRVGIASGQVVVGDIVGDISLDAEAVTGETPNLAARLQQLAEPGNLIIDEATQLLLGQAIELIDLGPKTLKGFNNPVNAWRVGGETGVRSRFEASQARILTPLVGRTHELGLLLDRWELAKVSEGQTVLISGEAGIGKSRLVSAMRDEIRDDKQTQVSLQCSPYHTESAFYPIIEQLKWMAGFEPGDTASQKLGKLEAKLANTSDAAATLIADLLSLPTKDRDLSSKPPPEQQRQWTLTVLVDQVLALTGQQPVLITVEDVHWSDPSTLELLEQIMSQIRNAPVLMVLTTRPELLTSSLARWGTHLSLNQLGQGQTKSIIEEIAGGKRLPAEFVDLIIDKTGGIPLFVEQLTRTVLEAGFLQDMGRHYVLNGPLPELAIPTTLQGSLTARLDRLGSAKEVAQIGAVLGRVFSYDLLAALSPLNEGDLRQALEQLIDAGLLHRDGRPPEATYTFRHALIRDAGYDSLLLTTRQGLHARAARLLAEHYPEVVENQPALVAYHYSEAGEAMLAATASQRAAQHAVERSANAEAEANAQRGLQALREAPETVERNELELQLQITLGSALVATKGYRDPAVGSTYERARVLCEAIGDTEKLLLILRGQHVHEIALGRMQQALDTAEQFSRVAEATKRREFQIGAQHNLSQIRFMLGNPASALTEGEKGIELFDPERQGIAGWAGGAPIVQCYVWSAAAAALLGDHHRSMDYATQALRLNDEIAQDFSRVHCYTLLCIPAVIRRDVGAAAELGERAIEICSEYNFPYWREWARMVAGWAKAHQGDSSEALGECRQACSTYRELGIKFCEPFFLFLLAEVAGLAGATAEGLTAANQALAISKQTAEQWPQAEIYRLQSKLLVADYGSARSDPEGCLRSGIEIATAQGANLLTLRCAISLARMQIADDKRQEAHDLLAPIYNRWPDGYHATDFQEAEALLGEL